MHLIPLNKMAYQAIAALLGFVGLLFAIFPRPLRRLKADAKFYAQPPALILPVNILNQVDRALQDFLGVRLIKGNKEELLKLIRSVPKSDLFGPQDEIEEGLKKFIDGFLKSKPSAFGLFANNRYRRINHEKRKQVMEYIIKNPSIANIPIKKPIIIMGMMRTGSTLLFNLLNQDPNCRSPFLWEMAGTNPDPTPPSTSKGNDPRIQAVDKAILTYRQFVPTLLSESAKSHFTAATEIEECLFILIHQGIHQVLLPLSGPEYLEWFLNGDNKEFAYTYLKRYLQMLSSGYAPKSHWTLKAPIHSLYVAQLAKTFPDALFVITHRDPHEVVPSTCKLFEVGTHFHFEPNTLDRRWIGETACRMSETMCNRIMEYREQHGSERFYDARYPDLLEDPIGVVKKIYQQAGHDYTPEFEARMQEYMKENPQGKHGRNKYSLDIYGLSEEQIDQKFAKYRKTYNI